MCTLTCRTPTRYRYTHVQRDCVCVCVQRDKVCFAEEKFDCLGLRTKEVKEREKREWVRERVDGGSDAGVGETVWRARGTRDIWRCQGWQGPVDELWRTLRVSMATARHTVCHFNWSPNGRPCLVPFVQITFATRDRAFPTLPNGARPALHTSATRRSHGHRRRRRVYL